MDLGSRASFEYVVEQAAGERFPSVRIDAAFERTGPALEGIESLELVWCCGQSPVVAGAEMKPGEWTSGKAFIAGSRLAFGGKRWLAIVSEKGVKARYVPSFNGGHELRIPLPIVRGGRIGQGDEYKITFSLQSVL